MINIKCVYTSTAHEPGSMSGLVNINAVATKALTCITHPWVLKQVYIAVYQTLTGQTLSFQRQSGYVRLHKQQLLTNV